MAERELRKLNRNELLDVVYEYQQTEKKLRENGYETDSGWDYDWFEFLNIGKDGYWIEIINPDVGTEIYLELSKTGVKEEQRKFLKQLYYDVTGKLYKERNTWACLFLYN